MGSNFSKQRNFNAERDLGLIPDISHNVSSENHQGKLKKVRVNGPELFGSLEQMTGNKHKTVF